MGDDDCGGGGGGDAAAPSRRAALGTWLRGGSALLGGAGLTSASSSSAGGGTAAVLGGAAAAGWLGGRPAPAEALGTLPETAALPRVCARAVVAVAETQPVLDFFEKSMSFRTLRQVREADGSLVSTLAFGPDAFAVPPTFVPGISAFAEYGGHFTLRLVERPAATAAAPPPPPSGEEGVAGGGTAGAAPAVPPSSRMQGGEGLAYLALGVPQYRISKFLENGGQIISSYGFTRVNAPGGLPLQVVLGDQVRDPFMFAALYAKDLKASEAFYTETMGMRRCAYPRAREAEVSSFEPAQPKGSVYLSYSDDSFGVLLLPTPKKRKQQQQSKSKKPPTPELDAGGAPLDPVTSAWEGLEVVATDFNLDSPGNRAVAALLTADEPNGLPLRFIDEATLYADALAAAAAGKKGSAAPPPVKPL